MEPTSCHWPVEQSATGSLPLLENLVAGSPLLVWACGKDLSLLCGSPSLPLSSRWANPRAGLVARFLGADLDRGPCLKSGTKITRADEILCRETEVLTAAALKEPFERIDGGEIHGIPPPRKFHLAF